MVQAPPPNPIAEAKRRLACPMDRMADRRTLSQETAAMLHRYVSAHGRNRVAREVGVHPTSVYRLTSGKRAPSLTVALDLIRVLEMSEEDGVTLLAEASAGHGYDLLDMRRRP